MRDIVLIVYQLRYLKCVFSSVKARKMMNDLLIIQPKRIFDLITQIYLNMCMEIMYINATDCYCLLCLHHRVPYDL